jgi:hypothetical protein
MNERQFISELVQELDLKLPDCRVATHKSILYDLTIDDDGVVRMGVDTETGEPVRGRGKGFEQDLLIYESPKSDALPVVPRVIAEVKYHHVTTHDAIVYSEKARRIRAVYPYIRYGLILGGFSRIPGRVLRLGQGFDYVLALAHPLEAKEVAFTRKVFAEELQASRALAKIAFGRQKIATFRRKVDLGQ